MRSHTAWIALLAIGLTGCTTVRPAANNQPSMSSTISSVTPSAATTNPAPIELPSTTSTTTTTGPSAKICEDEPGGPLDVAGEPDWRRHADYSEWTDTDGCLIRIDVLAERTGPEHCDWETARVLITGNPLGSRYFDSESDVEYVFDPNGAYGVPEFIDGLQIRDSLPSDAVDTGFRQGDRELWISPEDPHAIYLRTGAGVERWPEGTVPVCM